MKLTYVIVTRNRRDALLQTLARIEADTGLPRGAWEAFVVDNASDDGTAEALAEAHPHVQLIRLAENEGVPARNYALPPARGKYIAFLDDDSYPLPGAIPRALEHLSRCPRTAALVARVILPNGAAEAPALPGVTIGGASIIRRDVLEEVGGFDPTFIRQAEEYDLSFRIWQAGYRVERFEDLCFGHDKVPGGRSSDLTRHMDLRNNLIVAERYLPREVRRVYRKDWLRRYAALARHDGHSEVIAAALRQVRDCVTSERIRGRRIVGPQALEAILQWDAQANAVARWAARLGVHRVVIADYSKNIYATWRACRLAKLDVIAVLENHPAYAGHAYRGHPIEPDARLVPGSVDAIVLSNVNPAQVDERMKTLSARFEVPILRLWEPRLLGTRALGRPMGSVTSDPTFGPPPDAGAIEAA